MSESKTRALAALGERIDNTLDKKSTRRGFLKSTIVAGLAVAGGLSIAGKVKKVVLKDNNGKKYRADELGVEKAWKGRKLYLMSKDEKNKMVAKLLKSYNSGGV